ncbi:MAG: methyltransferase domain-containing protein [Planctomycetota bacterium]
MLPIQNNSSQYTDEEFETNYPEGMENYYWTYSRNLILLSELHRHSLLDKKILEIGCGKGLVIQFLRKHQINIWGSELGNVIPFPEIQEYIYTNKDCLILSEEFRNTIEVIMLLDVLEHIEDSISFLKNIIHHYPNLSYIYITVPARMELWSSYDIFYRHYRRYTLCSLQKMVSSLEMKIVDSGYLFRILYLPALWVAKTSGKRNHTMTAPKKFFSRWIHRIMAYLLYLDYKIIYKKMIGSSLYCLLQKK